MSKNILFYFILFNFFNLIVITPRILFYCKLIKFKCNATDIKIYKTIYKEYCSFLLIFKIY